MKLFLFLVQMAAPWVLRLIWASLASTFFAMVAFWKDVPATANRLADYWLQKAIIAGWSTLHTSELRSVLLSCAYLSIIFGWVIMSFMTVYIVNVIF
jgi:hypothetical protein